MNRHLLAGRYGPDDQISIPSASDEQVTYLQLVAGEKSLDHGIGEALASLKALGVYPSEIGLDLLVLAAHVYAADTRISRVEQSQDSWTREIRLVVPVSDPDRWNAAAQTVKRTLDFLTGDRWMVGFRSRPERFAELAPRPETLFLPAFDVVSLFSGGLDSLIGTVDLLEQGRTPLLVSHAGDGATSKAQHTLFAALQKQYSGAAFNRLRFWMLFPTEFVKGVSSENSTRGRSFLFFALGVFAGTGLRTDFVLRVPENGLIALNVPLDPLRLGSNSTRTTHPYYIARWNELLGDLGISGHVENPYSYMTKGEMAAACANPTLLKALVPHALSCAHSSNARHLGIKGRGIEQCGYCLPCLIRRAALNKAFGPGNDATPYTLSDLRAHPLGTRESNGQQVRSFQFAIERLRAAPHLAKVLIHKPGSLADEISRLDQLAAVYQRGLAEVGQLIEGVETAPD